MRKVEFGMRTAILLVHRLWVSRRGGYPRLLMAVKDRRRTVIDA